MGVVGNEVVSRRRTWRCRSNQSTRISVNLNVRRNSWRYFELHAPNYQTAAFQSDTFPRLGQLQSLHDDSSLGVKMTGLGMDLSSYGYASSSRSCIAVIWASKIRGYLNQSFTLSTLYLSNAYVTS